MAVLSRGVTHETSVGDVKRIVVQHSVVTSRHAAFDDQECDSRTRGTWLYEHDLELSNRL